MTLGPIANIRGALASASTIVGTPLVSLTVSPTKFLPAVPLKSYNPSLVGLTQTPSRLIPIPPLPGGGSTVVGVVGSPIDSG